MPPVHRLTSSQIDCERVDAHPKWVSAQPYVSDGSLFIYALEEVKTCGANELPHHDKPQFLIFPVPILIVR